MSVEENVNLFTDKMLSHFLALLGSLATVFAYFPEGCIKDGNVQHFLTSVNADTSSNVGAYGTSGSHMAIGMKHSGSCYYFIVHYDKDSHSRSYDKRRGAQFTMHPNGFSRSATDATFSYEVYFPTTLKWNKNGQYTHIGGKLPGLYGGRAKCSGGRPTDGCFSTRYMWREYGHGELYLYFDHSVQKGGFDSWKNDQDSGISILASDDGYGTSIRTTNFKFKHGNWHTLTQQVHLNSLNSHGYNHDGFIRVELNGPYGTTSFTLKNMVLRTGSTTHIDGVYFSTFFGGHDRHWASQEETYTMYRHFSIS